MKADLLVVHLVVDPKVAAQRRVGRAGKRLSERHCKIVTTKAVNTASACRSAGVRVVDLDASKKAQELSSAIRVYGV